MLERCSWSDVFPLKLAAVFRWPILAAGLPLLFRGPALENLRPAKVFREAVAKEGISASARCIVPQVREGGCFLYFEHGDAAPHDVEQAVKRYLAANSVKPWWSPVRTMQVGLVKRPQWVGGLLRSPSTRVKAELVPPAADNAGEPTHEGFYNLFRPYGNLVDISFPSLDSKVLPLYAYLDFASLPAAIMAKNCMHGSKINADGKPGPTLRLTYEQKSRPHSMRDWLFSHPRIVIPILAAILAGVTVAIFDPYVLCLCIAALTAQDPHLLRQGAHLAVV